MKNFVKRRWVVGAIVIGLVVVIGGIGIARAHHQRQSAKKVYQTYTVKVDSALLLKGKVAAKNTVDVQPGVSSTGTLTQVNVKNGEHVDPGSVLMTFHDDQVQSQIDDAEQTKEKTALAIQNDNQAVTALQKQPTTTADAGSIDDETDQGVAADSVQQAKNQLASDQLALRQTNTSLANLQGKVDPVVTAKIAGTVVLDDSATDKTGTPSMQIISDGQIIDGQVTEYDYAKLRPRMRVTVLPVSSNQRLGGNIVTIDQTPQSAANQTATSSGQTAENEAATYQFKVKMAKQLTNGFNVQIRVPQTTIHLPATSLITKAGRHYVYVVRKHKVYKTEVTVKKVAGYWQLMSGVAPKTVLIANTAKHQLKSGQEVATHAD
ncbi:efflux RND transporter periplasmic adaptor subunit [Loigolactobacillus iwatensis]|uniref:efflux RND transporter periplasmic adaptor subunit n=1 Tax=Loigolactobacillus iwatensis TaxID=1267156 RepID=UPI000F7E47B9|nr:efflux RND transporter periplasmic adaptor subunit [Loigolactobacillus iwatensis]